MKEAQQCKSYFSYIIFHSLSSFQYSGAIVPATFVFLEKKSFGCRLTLEHSSLEMNNFSPF